MTVHDAAVVDTDIIAALKLYDPAELPDTMLITAITLTLSRPVPLPLAPRRAAGAVTAGRAIPLT